MYQLKDVWDNFDSQSSDVSVEEQLDVVMRRIGKKSRILKYAGIVSALAACVALAFIFSTPAAHPQVQAAPKMLQCYVPYGSIQTMVLADSTVVKLNSGTSLVYPESFTGDMREVFLNGEASFSVTKDPARPFIVNTNEFNIEVLGTVFNVNAYSGDKSANVVLSEGRIKLSGENFDTFLGVGQKAEFSKENESLTVSTVDPSDYFLWENGGISLCSAGIDELVTTIERLSGKTVKCNNAGKYRSARITYKTKEVGEVEDFLGVLVRLIPGMKYEIKEETIYLN